ncbi:guanine nucleotide exchange factor [Kockovaella imperatae]|uniref:Guanine nucleotide exchange factor n=1 Tax=Kockovaella imperatae TaxID=4999 RepID=A0A1Y1UJ13_9TREE|nr:guanine nucleotide exchange factor [Kockovaella imperatae]ORX37095.1 guanine nucleotide exchange factor [Kockovaella imperatae]
MQMVTVDGYLAIGDRASQLSKVKEELESVVSALPTQIHPDDRTKFLDALLGDLADRHDAPWTLWPENIHLLTLTAIKSLGRNPIGSEPLLFIPHIRTILYHSSLPLSLELLSSSPSDDPAPVSPGPNPSGSSGSSTHARRPSPDSPHALEALRILANLLVLHPEARESFTELGGGRAIAQALAGLDGEGQVIPGCEDEEDPEELYEIGTERLFLLGRLGFLATIDRSAAVKMMVDEEDLNKSLAYHLSILAPVQANFMALTELLKLVNNVIRFYPHATPSMDAEPWSEAFDILLAPCLGLLYSLPFISLAPPLSSTLHVLLGVPFLPRLLSVWESVPKSRSIDSNSSSPTSTTSTVKNLLNKMSIASPQRRATSSRRDKSPSPPRDRAAQSQATTGRPTTPVQQRLSPPRRFGSLSRSPKTPPRVKLRASPLRIPDRPVPLSPTRHDPTALPRRVLAVLKDFFDTYLPLAKNPDEALPQGLVLEEALPPVFLLLARAVMASDEMRLSLKEELLPRDLDRSAQAGPLEKRPGLLGAILRCMQSSSHHQTRDTAGELMWAICQGDASTLSAEIGYGNAAGLLFRKGISGLPPGKIETIDDERAGENPAASAPASLGTRPSILPLNPITSLEDAPSPGASTSSFADLSPEDQDREASKLFDLFDRLDRNPVLKAQGPNGQAVGIKEALKEKMVSAEVESEAQERAMREAEEQEDEESVRKEMEAYRQRRAAK